MTANILDLIGHTPVVPLSQDLVGDQAATVYVKLEYFNPFGSVKDRVAYQLVKIAEESGQLKPGQTLIEATSGNTGIALAAVGAAKGYPVTIVMPDSMSAERKQLVKAYGATLIETPAADGMKGALAVVKDLVEKKGYLEAGQFYNQANPQAHYEGTGPEIKDFFHGVPDAFVAGIGTGGTITGAGKYLREQGDLKIVAVEPAGSPILEGGQPGPHKIQGIGAGFVPEVLDTKIYDQVIGISNEDAADTARILASKQALLLGYSSGAAVAAAIQVAKDLGPGKKVLAITADNGERYLSTNLYQ
ncbi:cysteine synthase A [Lactobacillaceae bacterium L1_55_11]|nr:cysteine synthase A [Lactobacillaceae bacterium L1_55_11]